MAGSGEGSVERSAARREAVSPGSKVGFLSTFSIFIVGSEYCWRALWIFGELIKPMLRRRRSWERETTCGVLDGTLSHVQGVGEGKGCSVMVVVAGDGSSGGAFGSRILLALPLGLDALSWKM